VNVEVRPYRLADEPAVRAIMEASLEFDRFPGFTAWDLEDELATMAVAPAGVAVALEDGEIAGYVGPRQDDLTVHPDRRRGGVGRLLFQAGLQLATRAGLNELTLYVPPAVAGESFARAMGLTYRSSLWQLGLEPCVAVPAPVWPAGVAVATAARGLDLDRFVELLNAAFADHPSPMSWTRDEIDRAHARPGFDATAVLVATPVDRPTEPIAFIRTAVGPAEANPGPGADKPSLAGEIRLVGVLPEWRGRGLGRELLRWGIADLRSRGVGRIQLNVEARNAPALGLYRRTGFEPLVEWPHWSRRV